FGELTREYLLKRGEMTPNTYLDPLSSKRFQRLFGNYPPLSREFWETVGSDGVVSKDEQAALEFYTTNTITVIAESFAQSP
ncbi:MAG TPA: hypothetical protein VN843_30430, partial [Anaerolineales bacterium]|nr:hypothetical protein [Anaerolineales bacterium]